MLIPLLAVLAAALVYFVYARYLHPIAHVPGPWYTVIGDVWTELAQFRLSWSRSIHALFDEYGPVVRIGYNKIAFLDEPTQRIVYGNQSKLAKDKYYKRFVTAGNDHAMTILDHGAWSVRRRASAPHYTMTNLAPFEPDVERYTLQLLDGILADGGKTSFDLMSLFRHLLVDIVFSTAFGMHNGTVEKWARNEVDPLDRAVTDFPKLTLLYGLLPSFFLPLIARLPNPRIRQFIHADAILHKASKRVYDTYAGDAEKSFDQHTSPVDASTNGDAEHGTGERKSLIQRMMEYRLPESEGGRRLREDEILSETQAHLIAGSETTSTTAAYAVWELTQHPEILAKVREELDNAVQEHSVANWNVLFALPWFNAFIKETLRLYAIIPGPLPRVIPQNMDLMIRNLIIPPGTTVATQAWSVHRRENIWKDARTFRPQRWFEPENAGDQVVETDKEKMEKMKANFMPFGIGPRVCVGQNLGQIMLRVMISTIVRHFDIVPAPETTPHSMRIWESFALFPAGLEAKFILTPRASLHHH